MRPQERTVLSTEEMVAALSRHYTSWVMRHPAVLTLLSIVGAIGLVLLVTMPTRALAGLGGGLLALLPVTYGLVRWKTRSWLARWFPPGTPVSFALRPDGFWLSSAHSSTLRGYDRIRSVGVRGEATMITLTGSRQEIVIVPTALVSPDDLHLLSSQARALGH